jgi:hypothetical protein
MLRIKAVRLFLALAITLLTPLTVVGQSDIAGDWQGMLKSTGDKKKLKLRVVLHIMAAPGGILTATIDSIDQDSPGIPVSAVTYENATLKLEITQVQGSFEGKINKDGTEIKGIWTEGESETLKLKRVKDPTKVAPPPIPIGGEWHGMLSVTGKQLGLVLHVNTTNYSRPIATIDGIDQSAHGVNPITLKGNVLKFTVGAVNGSYVGTVSDDGNQIEGVWKQGQAFPLIFHRIAQPMQPVNETKPHENPIVLPPN